MGVCHLDATRAHGALALRASSCDQVLRPLQQLCRHALPCAKVRMQPVNDRMQRHAWRLITEAHKPIIAPERRSRRA